MRPDCGKGSCVATALRKLLLAGPGMRATGAGSGGATSALEKMEDVGLKLCAVDIVMDVFVLKDRCQLHLHILSWALDEGSHGSARGSLQQLRDDFESVFQQAFASAAVLPFESQLYVSWVLRNGLGLRVHDDYRYPKSGYSIDMSAPLAHGRRARALGARPAAAATMSLNSTGRLTSWHAGRPQAPRCRSIEPVAVGVRAIGRAEL